MYIVIAMNHKYLGHLTYATCRSYDPFSYGCLMYSSIFKWWDLTMCNHNHIITLSFAFERLTISDFFFWWIFTMFQPEKSDFQLGTRQWKFTKFQKRKKKIKLPDFCSRFQKGSPEYIMLLFFLFFPFIL